MTSQYMREALDLARKGRSLASPNPLVGAILVREGEVVGRGFHTYAGLHHAEIIALAQAGDKARGATLYLNLEPCSHHGRTPPCVDALIQAGVARVVAPVTDPNPLVAGQGFARLREAGIEVEIPDEFAADAAKLNEPFLHFMRTGRPLVTLKTAITLDGKISAPDDNRGWITSERARAHVQEIRHDHDAILTGIGTVLADDCLLSDRTGHPRCRPFLRIVMDSLLRLPLDSKMVRSAAASSSLRCRGHKWFPWLWGASGHAWIRRTSAIAPSTSMSLILAAGRASLYPPPTPRRPPISPAAARCWSTLAR
jgi:diaminohydroxyphosphoribosylaminopyrimidine deaminase/5-amino-6-(5-phosphoribosylamino)uracil reductase